MKDKTNWEEAFDKKFIRGLWVPIPGSNHKVYIRIEEDIRDFIRQAIASAEKRAREEFGEKVIGESVELNDQEWVNVLDIDKLLEGKK